ncbi:hypothetical protein XENOCAPTIV_014432, partial [Xenoophorus captivus]
YRDDYGPPYSQIGADFRPEEANFLKSKLSNLLEEFKTKKMEKAVVCFHLKMYFLPKRT